MRGKLDLAVALLLATLADGLRFTDWRVLKLLAVDAPLVRNAW